MMLDPCLSEKFLYQEAKVKLTNTEIKKLKSAAKNKIGIILRINK